MLEEEHKKIPLIHRANGIIIYEILNGSYYFSFKKHGFVYKKRLENKRVHRSEEDIVKWDTEKLHIPYLFDPPLSDREIKFLDKVGIITNIGERLYTNMQESGTTNTFAKLGKYFNLTDDEMELLLNEIIKGGKFIDQF